MASKRDRERKLERARTERRIARQAQKARQRRQVQAIVGAAVALVLIVLGVIFVLKPFSSNAPEAGGCLWVPIDTSNPSVKDVGTPPTSGEPTTGTETMTITTKEQGKIVITLDLDESPCAAASMAYLASKNFFDGTSCNLLSAQLKVLKCGDPKGDGSGSPAYSFADEYIPQEPVTPTGSLAPTATPTPTASGGATGPFYSAGQVVMVNTGKDTNGSQFYIVYGDGSSLSNAYTVIGSVTSGMDAVTKVAAAGAVDDTGKAAAEGKPKSPLTITTLTVSAPDDGASPSDSDSAGVPQS